MRKGRIIGLTGPTGAGKGAVCDCLRRAGYGIVDTDRLAREVVKPHHPCLEKLVEAFSPAILREDGTLNRQKLAELAFASKEQTEQLNAITHPAIWALAETELEAIAASDKKGAVIDAPALFESGMDRLCDSVIAVTAEETQRLKRLRERDGLSDEALLRRMKAQPPLSFYEERADAVIVNNGSLAELEQRVEALLVELEEA